MAKRKRLYNVVFYISTGMMFFFHGYAAYALSGRCQISNDTNKTLNLYLSSNISKQAYVVEPYSKVEIFCTYKYLCIQQMVNHQIKQSAYFTTKVRGFINTYIQSRDQKYMLFPEKNNQYISKNCVPI